VYPNPEWGPGLHASEGALDYDAYDRYLGRWSRLFVPAVVAAAQITRTDRVLDVATGPGEAAVGVLSVVEQAGRVFGADVSMPMLDAARARLGSRLCAVAMDGQALAFRDDSFDAVVCQLGLMFFADPVQGLEEFRRVLRPGRRAAVSFLGTAEQVPMWGALADALAESLPRHREVLTLSFSLGDAAKVERLFAAAGFHDIQVQTVRRTAVFESFEEYWRAVEGGAGSLPHALRSLPPDQRHKVRDRVQSRLREHQVRGRLELGIEVLMGAGRALSGPSPLGVGPRRRAPWPAVRR
jgi:ubiquinone/menaquinone biosynthesis C-methylase UbiE